MATAIEEGSSSGRSADLIHHDPRSDTLDSSIGFVREVLRAEAEAIAQVEARIDSSIVRAAELILHCQGSIVVTGMGKAGLVGQKLAATLASTGTHAFPMHPGDAVHGDLGRVRAIDLVLALSWSGETGELNRLIPTIQKIGALLVSITGRQSSTLGLASDLCIATGPIDEACHLGLAPSASTTAMMAVGDALALLVSRNRGFSPDDFLRYHPGGSLGRKLGRVSDVMRTGRRIRTARPHESIRSILVRHQGARRRSGAVLVVGDEEQLLGIFTDSDLARLFEGRREELLDRPIADAMTVNPVVIHPEARLTEAVELLRNRKLSELPVVTDPAHQLCGLVDITDLIGREADEWEA